MKYKLIKTIVNTKTQSVQQTVDIYDNDEELENYWKRNSNITLTSGASGTIGDVSYYMQTGKILGTYNIVTIIQYSLNYLP